MSAILNDAHRVNVGDGDGGKSESEESVGGEEEEERGVSTSTMTTRSSQRTQSQSTSTSGTRYGRKQFVWYSDIRRRTSSKCHEVTESQSFLPQTLLSTDG